MMDKRFTVVAADHYQFCEPAGALSWACWSLFQAIALRDFKTSYSLFPGLQMGPAVLVSLLRDSSLTCSLKKLWRLCCLPRQSVPHVSLLRNLMLLSCNLSPLVLEAGEQFVPSSLLLYLCVWKKLSYLPSVSSRLSNLSFPVHHAEARLLLAGDSFQ